MNNNFIRLKKFFGRLMSYILVFFAFLNDLLRFSKYSIMSGLPKTFQQYQALLIKDSHKIEKALISPDFKTYSAKDPIKKIFFNIDSYKNMYGLGLGGIMALDVLEMYVEKHKKLGCQDKYILGIEKKLRNLRNDLLEQKQDTAFGGFKRISKDDILSKSHINLSSFFNSRHSVRCFTKEHVKNEVVKEAVSLALKTPSVCNRQGWRCYLVKNEILVSQILSVQEGCRSFEEHIKNVIVVVSDLNCFNGVNERNQHWVDGGMFSMSLVYALHSKGVGSCCLGWMPLPSKDRKIRKLIPLRKSESIIMLIAIGNYPENIAVCLSTRKGVEDVLEIFE